MHWTTSLLDFYDTYENVLRDDALAQALDGTGKEIWLVGLSVVGLGNHVGEVFILFFTPFGKSVFKCIV